jgi:nitrite reductase/ring-hydroxylating ferredoxin subunit
MTWHPVATVIDAERAAPWLAARVAGKDLAIARLGDAWFAVEDECTHAGCPFSSDADLVEGTILCNCHGSEFDLQTGEVLRGPAEYPVRTFPVRVSGDQLEVDI